MKNLDKKKEVVAKRMKKEWTKSDEMAHLSDVKANRSWNKFGKNGAKNPHL